MRTALPPSLLAGPALIAGTALALSGCGSSIPPGTSDYDVERYALSGEYDWAADRLNATVKITMALKDPDARAVTLDSAVHSISAVTGSYDDRALPFYQDPAAKTLTVDVSGIRRDPSFTITIEYKAVPSDGLRAVPAREGDPVSVRALYTDSEPVDAPLWMPCHNRPDDRALFSVEMIMDKEETMISNGEKVHEQLYHGESRLIKYDTKYTLPPYLMAFAISQFEVETAEGSAVPISVWHRPGVAGDYPLLLSELDRLISTFSDLMGPYPFDQYSLVMLPDFSGGMENASITFQSETATAQPSLDITLTAHELGHQWFGDAVTVESWDDVWIKEGMATLLGEEATRPFEDQSQTGGLFGERFYVQSGAAVRDTSLEPALKYTTGPYDRGAWLLSQLRRATGEETFWATLRGIQEAHRFGTINTEQMLAAFAPHLGKGEATRAANAVDAKDLPTLEVAASGAGGAVLTLNDPGQILVAPVELEWHRESGAVETVLLVPGEPAIFERTSPGDFLVADPADVHPALDLWLIDEESQANYYSALALLFAPDSAAGVTAFSEIGGVSQLVAMSNDGLPPVEPADLEAFVASLDAESARVEAIGKACHRASAEEDPTVQGAWQDVVTKAISGEPSLRGLQYTAALTDCEALISQDLFASEWSNLAGGLAAPAVSAERLYYMTSITLRPPSMDPSALWLSVAQHGYSTRVRSMAARSLRRPLALYPEGIPDSWYGALLTLLAESETSEVLRQLLPAGRYFIEAPPQRRDAFVAECQKILQSPIKRMAHAQAVCVARTIIGEQDQAAWQAFVGPLAGADVSASAQRYLDDPSTCP